MTSGASGFIHLLNVGIAKSGISGVREGGEFELRGRRGRIPGCIRADSDAVEGLSEGRVVHNKQVGQAVLFSMRGEHPPEADTLTGHDLGAGIRFDLGDINQGLAPGPFGVRSFLDQIIHANVGDHLAACGWSQSRGLQSQLGLRIGLDL